MDYPRTLRELRAARYKTLSVKDELRLNLIRKLRTGEKLFPGIVGYQDTVIPQLINAILSRHNIILLGLRGPDQKSTTIPFDRSRLMAARYWSKTAISLRSIGSVAMHVLSRN